MLGLLRADELKVYGMLFARELPQVTVPDTALPMNIDQARHFIERAAYLGFAKAQVRMAAAYELCQLGCEFDPIMSLHYNNLAARQGEPEAEMAISKWFLSGCEGIFHKNEGMAFTFAQRAALAGLPTAEFALGYYYEVGIHVKVDINEAKVWYKKAADSGNKDAAGRIDGISRSKTLSRKDHEKIAVERIKSTRGTRPNKRPGRFTNQGNEGNNKSVVMPSIPDMQGPVTPYGQEGGQPLAMPMGPDPGPYNTPYGRNSPSSGYRASNYSAPPQAAAPYPNPNLNPNAYQQYPSQGPQPSRSPVGRGGYYPTGPTGQPQPQSYYRGPSPTPPQGASPYPQGYRVSSAGYPPQHGGPSPGPGGPNASQPQVPPKGPKPPGADFGFSAPPDFDRRPMPPRSDSARPSAGTPTGSGPNKLEKRPGPQHASTFQAPAPSPAPLSTASSRPPRTESMPAGPVGSGPTPPPANTGSGRPGQPPIRRQGKGPATFEEMGVPNAKKDEDCVSFYFPRRIFTVQRSDLARVRSSCEWQNGSEAFGNEIGIATHL